MCSPNLVEHIVKASGHDLRKLLMLLQFWSQGLPVGTENLDCDPVLEMKQVNRNHIPDLINCLLQLDGCPQVFATTYESDQKPLFARCSNRAHEIPGESLNSTIDWGNSRRSSSREGESIRKIEEGILDPEWLFAYDSQHRVLPLLFSSSQPCQLAIQISEHLKGMGEKAIELVDIAVATWERHRFNELQAKAEEATQARKALRKLQLAARKEASAKSGMTNVVTDDVPEEILLERIANNSLSIGDRLILNERYNVIQPPLGHVSHVSRGIFSPTILSEGFDTLKGAPSELMHRQDDRLDDCFTTTNISESEHRLLCRKSMLQNQSGTWSQVVNEAEQPVDFSFTKLMQSSYDSPAAQTAIKECNEDTWSLLQGDCEEDSPFPDLSMGHDAALDKIYQSGMTMTTLPVNDNEWMKPVQEPTPFLTPGRDSAPHLHGIGWVLPQRHCGLEVCPNRGVLHLERLGFPLQQNIQLVAAESSPLLFPIFIPQQRPVELGAVISTCAETLVNKDLEQLNQNPTAYLTVSDNTKALDQKVETLPCVDTLASNFMKQVWVKLRELKLQDPLSDATGESVLLEDVLHDLSTCDILSTRNMATAQVFSLALASAVLKSMVSWGMQITFFQIL